MEHPMRLTLEELGALGRLRSIPGGPRIPTDDLTVEAGMRSLLSRGLLVASGGTLEIASALSELVSVVGSGDLFLVVGKGSMSDQSRDAFSGRLIAANTTEAGSLNGYVVIEDQHYPGVFEYGKMRDTDVGEYLRVIFGFDGDTTPRAAPEDSPSVAQLTLQPDPAGGFGLLAPTTWTDAVVNSVLLVRAEDPRVILWVREGERVWEVLPSRPGQADGTVMAQEISPAAVVHQLRDVADSLAAGGIHEGIRD